jgi:hypothetical protein
MDPRLTGGVPPEELLTGFGGRIFPALRHGGRGFGGELRHRRLWLRFFPDFDIRRKMDGRIRCRRVGGNHHLGLRFFPRIQDSLGRLLLYHDDLPRGRIRPGRPVIASPKSGPGSTISLVLSTLNEFRLRFLGALCFLGHNPPLLIIPTHPDTGGEFMRSDF